MSPTKTNTAQQTVSKCHACHAKCSYMSPSATPATQKAAASTATCGNRARHQSQPSAIRATPATWNEGECLKVPRLPRETQVDVSKCHACHAKCSYMSASATPATQKAAASTATCGNRARHQSQPSATWNEGGRRWMSQSATPATLATQSAATCRQVPRLPRKKPRRPRPHVGTERATRASPVPYVPRLPRETKVDEGGCLKVPRLPRKVTIHVTKCHACQTKWRWMSQSATPATQSAATCRQVPRLPRKKPRRPRRHVGTERATRASPVPYVPRLPRETKVDVSKCHACHAK